MNAFTRLLCTDTQVRSAFADAGAVHYWWRAVLWLHGKSKPVFLQEQDRRLCVANGFRFYGILYRCLAVFLLLIGAALLGCSSYLGNISIYGGWITFGSAVFLLGLTSLAFRGADQFQAGRTNGRIYLGAFVAGLIGFLALASAFLSAGVFALTDTGILMNLVSLGAISLFGIGSYFIELIYLLAMDK